jgi:hypothetical protein
LFFIDATPMGHSREGTHTGQTKLDIPHRKKPCLRPDQISAIDSTRLSVLEEVASSDARRDEPRLGDKACGCHEPVLNPETASQSH